MSISEAPSPAPALAVRRPGKTGRARAAVIHLSVTLVVAAIAALLVFGVWYPYPYRTISGGLELFVLVVTVDVVIGPLLTAVVFNPAKSPTHLKLDLAVIAMLQLACLAYGVHTVFAARPVYMVFEIDRFRVIPAADLDPADLKLAAEPYDKLPLMRPRLVGTRRSEPGPEQLESVLLALEGKDLAQRPSFYRAYDLSRPDVISRGRPIQVLFDKYPDQDAAIRAAIADTGRSAEALRYIPLVARRQWVAFIDAGTADIVGYAPFDGF